MNLTFYLAAIIAVFATVLVFFTLGAPFAAALEVIVYAGAIMVLFVFVVMMLNLGQAAAAREVQWMQPRIWIGPSILSLILTVQLGIMLARNDISNQGHAVVGARSVGLALYGPYLLCVELASMLLLAALVGAYRLAHTARSAIQGGR